jgi:hypothetical protein
MRRNLAGNLVHCGREITPAEVAEIIETVRLFTSLSLTELVLTVCEHLEWFSASGGLKLDAGNTLLEEMEQAGLLKLPEKRPKTKNAPKKESVFKLLEPEEPIDARIGDLGEIRLVFVRDTEEISLWKSYVHQHHYLGNTRPFGCFARYFVECDRGKLGCLLFSGAAKHLADRDQWIGWTQDERERNNGFIVNNSRYLIFPWVKVKNLASYILGQVEKRIRDDWEQQWGYRPVLMETFVDPDHFDGTCYKAANWRCLGFTTGRGLVRTGKNYTSSPKMIFVRPLAEDFRATLCF